MIQTDGITEKQTRTELALDQYLPPVTSDSRLHKAMRYSALGGGKRIRALLVYGTGMIFDAPTPVLDMLAASIEMIHCYSLIHDDLPAMDDDDLRRGKPSAHKQFDDATAILAGDALHSLAFDILATEPRDYAHPEKRVLFIQTLARAIGPQGMALGQMLDLTLQKESASIDDISEMQQLKTGKLLQAGIQLGTLAGTNRNIQSVQALREFGQCIGLAFQIKDDILDVESSTEVLGKKQFSDINQDKPTYLQFQGMASAKVTLDELVDNALTSLEILGNRGNFLREITHFILKRNY